MPEPVSFYSQGARLTGALWAPPRKVSAAIIVTGSWLTVKEQMPLNYATRLADAGFAVLTFDFHGFGASEGAPREVESPPGKAEDLRNAAAFLRTHPAIDRDRIGALAICASSGYLATAMVGQSHFQSAVMVAPWLHDAAIVHQIYGGEPGVQDRLAQATAARETYARTGDVQYVPAASNSDSRAAMYWPGDALDYYLNPKRGAIPQWGARFALMAWQEWLQFDPMPLAEKLTVPTRIVTGEQSATPGGATQFAGRLRAAHDVIWMQGTQFDFYDNPETVNLAAEHAMKHFRSTLG